MDPVPSQSCSYRGWGGRLFCLLAALIAGCTVIEEVEEQDRAPARPHDVSGVRDAVPRAEPRSRYGNPKSYVVRGKRYYTLSSAKGYRQRGIASWYGEKFHGRRTSNQEVYDMYAMTAAHKTLPLPTYVRVTNLENGRQTVLRVNDRGPFHHNRIIDLSYAAAKKLGMQKKGTAMVEVETVYASQTAPYTPSPPVATPVSMPPAPSVIPRLNLYLQVGAFADPGNAVRLKSRLHSVSNAAIRISETLSGGHRVHRVRLGPLNGVEQADRLMLMLAELGLNDLHIIIE